MKKDCWVILGIRRTRDTSAIKKAYHNLIKQYHPDKVQAPEKIRKYTIKCVQIIEAYKEALNYAETHKHEPEIIHGETEPIVPVTTAPEQKKAGLFVRVIFSLILLLFTIPAIIVVLAIFDIKAPFIMNIIYFIPSYYDSMPFDSPLKMIISLPLAVILGAFINVLLSMFTTLPVYYLWGVLSDTRYEEYMYKIGYVIIAGINISVVYLASGLHWPFENRVNDYYNFLYHLCRFFAWSSGPIFMLLEWIIDNLKYLRVKDSLKSGELILYNKNLP